MYYDAVDVVDALGLLLKAGEEDVSLQQQKSYRFDVTDAAIQVTSNAALDLYHKAQDSFFNKDVEGLRASSKEFMEWLVLCESVTEDQEERLLGFWIAKAREAGGENAADADLFELNARTVVTLWGVQESGLHEYSYRLWADMVEGFYDVRWKSFWEKVIDSVETGVEFVQTDYVAEITAWEESWTRLTVKDVVLSTEVNGKGLEFAQVIYDKAKRSEQIGKGNRGKGSVRIQRL